MGYNGLATGVWCFVENAMFKNFRASPPPPTTLSSQPTAVSSLSGLAPGKKSPSHRPELVGVQFGWVVVTSPEVRRVKGFRQIHTRCVGCGEENWTSYDNLRRGLSKGCQRCSQPTLAPEWLVKRLSAARSRCENPNNPAYPNYGGRGVEFRFQSGTDAALWVMQNLGLEKDLEIDRVDNTRHYERGNLRWASRAEQMRNTRRTKVPVAPAWPSPYAAFTTARLLREGLTHGQILERAQTAVQEKRKGWQTIAEKLASMTS